MEMPIELVAMLSFWSGFLKALCGSIVADRKPDSAVALRDTTYLILSLAVPPALMLILVTTVAIASPSPVMSPAPVGAVSSIVSGPLAVTLPAFLTVITAAALPPGASAVVVGTTE